MKNENTTNGGDSSFTSLEHFCLCVEKIEIQGFGFVSIAMTAFGAILCQDQ